MVSSDKAGWSLIQGVGPDGEFRIGPLVPGKYRVAPMDWETPLGGFSLPEVDLGPGMEVDLGVVQIPAPTWMEVSIRYTDGVRVEESKLSLLELKDGRRRDLTTPWIRGTIRPTSYRPGRYMLSLQAKHHVSWSREIELVAGQTTTVDAVVERARTSRISLLLPAGFEAPDTLRVALRREGSEEDRTIDLLKGKISVALGLGSYVAEIQDAESSLTGTVRFVVRELVGPELTIQLPAR